MNILSGFGGGGRNLTIKFVADTAKAGRDIDKFFNQIQSKNAATKISGIGKMGEIGSSGFLSRAAGFFGITTAALKAGAAVTAFGIAMKETFSFGNLIEGSIAQLKVFTGSVEKSHAIMEEAIRFSMLTPFKPGETFAATSMAQQYGIDMFAKGKYGLGANRSASEIVAGLASFRNAQGEAVGLNRAVYAIAGGDTRLLRPFGPQVRAAYEASKKAGALRTSAQINAFLEGLGKIPQVMEMAKMYSETVSGLWSTIVGYGEEFWIRFSGAGEKPEVLTFWSQIRDILKDVRDMGAPVMLYLKAGLVESGASLGASIKSIWLGIKIIFKMLEPILKIAWQIFRVFTALATTVFVALIKSFEFLYNAVIRFFDALGDNANLNNMVLYMEQFVTGFQIALNGLVIWWGAALDQMALDLEAFIDNPAFRILKAFLGGVFSREGAAMATAGGLLGIPFGAVGAGPGAAIGAGLAGLQNVFRQMYPEIERINEKVKETQDKNKDEGMWIGGSQFIKRGGVWQEVKQKSSTSNISNTIIINDPVKIKVPITDFSGSQYPLILDMPK